MELALAVDALPVIVGLGAACGASAGVETDSSTAAAREASDFAVATDRDVEEGADDEDFLLQNDSFHQGAASATESGDVGAALQSCCS
jgi:hypothetical protein